MLHLVNVFAQYSALANALVKAKFSIWCENQQDFQTFLSTSFCASIKVKMSWHKLPFLLANDAVYFHWEKQSFELPNVFTYFPNHFLSSSRILTSVNLVKADKKWELCKLLRNYFNFCGPFFNRTHFNPAQITICLFTTMLYEHAHHLIQFLS